MGLLEVRFLALAALLHVSIPAMAAVAVRLERPMFARSSGIYHRNTIEIETLPMPEMERVRPIEPDRGAVAPRETESSPQARSEIDPRRRPGTTEGEILPPDQGSVEPGPVVTGPPTSEYDTVPESEGHTGLPPGVGGRPVWGITGTLTEPGRPAPAPTVAPAAPVVPRDIAGRVMGQALREADKKLGLDFPAGNTVASVVKDAILSSSTPPTARASFEVRIGPGGRVLSVRFLRSTAGAAGEWTAVAASVTARLSAREFHMPVAYAAGAIVMVEAISQMQMPDGTATGGPSLTRDGPPPGSIGGSMSFDASNLGARPKRIVRAGANSRPAK